MRSPRATTASASPQQVPVDAIERPVHGLVVKVLEQRRPLRETRPRTGTRSGRRRAARRAARRGRGSADRSATRRRPADPAASWRHRPTRSTSGSCWRGRQTGDAGSAVPFARRIRTPPRSSRLTGLIGHRLPVRPVAPMQRAPGHHRHLAPVPRDEIFGELGQQLAGRRLIGPVRSVEEAEPHVAGTRRCCLVPLDRALQAASGNRSWPRNRTSCAHVSRRGFAAAGRRAWCDRRPAVP